MCSKKVEDLCKTESFCSAPWAQLHVLTDGSVLPCCMWDYGKYSDGGKMGYISDHASLLDSYNTNKFKQLRKDLLLGNKVSGCHRCYTHEKHEGKVKTSFRSVMNDSKILTDNVKHSVANTNSDGSVDSLSISYIDVRFGNICNFKCRMCGHHLSSSWYDELVQTSKIKGGYAPESKFIHVDCYDKIEPLFSDIEEIYFAGGEPSLYSEHLRILDRLIEIGNTTVRLRYNTNLTSLKYKGRSFIDIWKHFSDVEVAASIDDMKDVVEYVRTGSNWNTLVQNVNTLLTDAPHVTLSIASTIGSLNLKTFPLFHKYAIENDWLSKGRINLSFVDWPHDMDIQNLPSSYKATMIEHYKDYQQWLAQNLDNYNVSDKSVAVNAIHQIISRLNVDVNEEVSRNMSSSLLDKLELWDKTLGVEWRINMPHLLEIFHESR
jgi:organic radical activating enzyme